MYSARLMLAWLPTGSGAPKESAYGPFLQNLTDGARAYRRARAISYEIQRTQREQRDVAALLDEARIKRQKSQQMRAARDLDAKLEDLNEGFRARTIKLEQLRPRLEEAKKQARAIAIRVYALEPSVTNAVFRPDPPDIPIRLHASPRLFGMLRHAREAQCIQDTILASSMFRFDEVGDMLTLISQMLEGDKEREQQAETVVQDSALRLLSAAAEVQQFIDLAERGALTTRSEIEAMTALQLQMDTHRTTLEQWTVLKAMAERRESDQWLYEEEMFWTWWHLCLRPTAAYYDFWRDELDDRRAVLASFNESWTGALQSLATGRSDAAGRSLDDQWNEDRMVAQELVKEAEAGVRQKSYELVDRCGEESWFDFPEHPNDGREDSEQPFEQRKRLLTVDPNAIRDWRKAVAESPWTAFFSQGSSKTWSWTPLELGEPGAYDFYWLASNEKRLRDALIKWNKRVADETRAGLAIAGSNSTIRLLKKIGAS
ncbi:hypothetical protein LTR56_010776 [Elasticomyces elasticus]|nr:hypothetical protein LTR56_010776 [Elasticomyces elasticus]KAK3667801.1 hypothetical protein LTR22_001246 [Elasticomyces elasticus]KAK4932206.1 hypothetical protein LTR49_001503 [Elasticomyces elasticus]KAK5763414.1 hypothetical protein LTS12_006385 [Elasticomyces elasticus]